MMIFTLLLYLINAATMITIIFFRKRDMSTTFAWLLFLIFIPVVGFIFYFFFGSTKKLEIMSKKYLETQKEKDYILKLEESMEMFATAEAPFKRDSLKKYRDMIYMNSNNGKCFFTQENHVELLVNGQEKFPAVFEEIKKAKKSINVMYFIYKTKDRIGKEMLDLLVYKAKEGVKVRLLYDSLGCLKTKLKDFAPLVEAGGQVQKFLPSTIKTLVEANYRLHRKMVVVDGQIAITGGINVGDDYLGEYAHISPWRDTSVKITGEAVRELQLIFFRDWVFCAKQNKKYAKDTVMDELKNHVTDYFPIECEHGNMGVQIIGFNPDNKYSAHRDSYLKMCAEAKEYLYIQSPYFVPDQPLLDMIRLAAQGGIDVRLMLPGIADKKLVYNVAMSYVEELLEAGVRIYTHKGFLHAKTLVIDDSIASVGTTNLDIRSFKLDYEVNTLTYSEDFAKICKETFLKDIKDCKEIELEEFKKRGNGRHFVESLCRFIAPLA